MWCRPKCLNLSMLFYKSLYFHFFFFEESVQTRLKWLLYRPNTISTRERLSTPVFVSAWAWTVCAIL